VLYLFVNLRIQIELNALSYAIEKSVRSDGDVDLKVFVPLERVS
jgi:hypothetical protein